LPCVDFAGTFRKSHFYRGGANALAQWRLIQLTKPNRLRAECTGIYPDGWSGAADSSYLRFATKRQGWLRIKISRENWPASPVHVRLSSIRNFHHQLVPGTLLREVRSTVRSQGTRVLWLRTPAKPFFAQVIVDRKFVRSTTSTRGAAIPGRSERRSATGSSRNVRDAAQVAEPPPEQQPGERAATPRGTEQPHGR
jgi:hypothetical protein